MNYVLLLFIAILFLQFLPCFGSPVLPYTWHDIDSYYVNSMPTKMNQVLNGECIKTYTTFEDSVIKLPQSESTVHVTEFPVPSELYYYWKNIPRPHQMRVEPFLCKSAYTKKNPIFNNSGCQLPDYMSISAPRCQIQYLKWACQSASIPVETVDSNGFVLPESDHALANAPPQPWMITARNSFVTMCGQIIGRCGMVHTTTNCKARGYKSQGAAFQRTCTFAFAANQVG